MKGLMKFSLLCMTVLTLVACGTTEESEAKQPKGSSSNSVYVYKDAETGCEYLIHYSGYAGGMTIRLDSEGKPICNK